MEKKLNIKNLVKKYNPVLNPQDVAEFLQINIKTVYKKIKNNEIEHWKEGRCYKIPLESMIQYKNQKLEKE